MNVKNSNSLKKSATNAFDAMSDVRAGWALRSSWWFLSRQAIKISYRRTVLGPIWLSIQQLVFVAGISIVYSQLFKVETNKIMPLAAFGFAIWSLLTSCITGAATSFIQNSQSIKTSTVPMSFYLFSSVSQYFLTFLHSAVVLVPLAFIVGTTPRLFSLITIPVALGFVILNGFFLGLWLGPLSARYRDIPVSIPIIMQLVMFLSPIFWSPALLGDRDWIINYNPLAWMIETFRSPILGGEIRLDLWVRLAILTLCNLVLGITTLQRVKDKISYWV